MDDQERLRRTQLRLTKENPAVQRALKREQAAARKLVKNTKSLSRPKRSR